MRQAVWSGAITFGVALLLGAVTNGPLVSVGTAAAVITIAAMIALGVAADMVGIAVTAAEEEAVNARSAKRVSGAGRALWLVRHAPRVSSLANDIVGDVTATLSGAAAAALALRAGSALPERARSAVVLGVMATVAALTVGGKAAGKVVAMRRAEDVVFAVGRLWGAVERVLLRPLPGAGQVPRRSRRK